MAPPKKSKKSKKDRKFKKILSLVPVEPKAADSAWWDSFFNPRLLEKSAYALGGHLGGSRRIGKLKKGLNPMSFGDLVFVSPYLTTAFKTGEGIAVGRSFSMIKNYHIDGNKEMIAIGMMNIAGSCTSCYLTTGPCSRSAVNCNAGCKTAMSNVVMAIAVMFTLLFLTPLFHYTALVVLSAIIIAAMLGLIDYEATIHLWKVDTFDFVVCMSACICVIFGSVEIGLVLAVPTTICHTSCNICYLTTGPFSRSAVKYNAGCKTAMSNVVMAIVVMFTLLFLTPLFHYTALVVLSAIIIAALLGLMNYEAAIHLWKVAISVIRVLLFVARARTFVQGNLPNSMVYRNVEQYPNASNVPGILILEIDAPIYFANTNYLRKRITRWINDEEDRIKSAGESSLQYVILDMTAVGNIDTNGISMFEEVKKLVDRRGLQLVLANPGSEVMKNMNKSELIEKTCQERIYLTVADAVAACNFMLHSTKPNPGKYQEPAAWNKV
ncbi:unnamed protein product [Prunus armeniaca]